MPITKALNERSGSKCELCSSTTNLEPHHVGPSKEKTLEHSVYLCEKCLRFVKNPEGQDASHWRCLSESMWSEVEAVQVMAWRILRSLSAETWAQDLFSQLYLNDETIQWAQDQEASSSHTDVPTKDSNGTILAEGDSVSLIKDLDVKGAGFTAKRGTLVKKIALTNNPLHIEGKVNGVGIVIISAYVKKV